MMKMSEFEVDLHIKCILLYNQKSRDCTVAP